jgi:glycosyltransferase involved in cell wall biosynthesis
MKKAHILIIADGRSPTTLSWIKNIQTLDMNVSLISTFPCLPPEGIRHFHIIPVAFSKFSSGKPHEGKQQKTSFGIKHLIRQFSPLFQRLRYLLGPLTLPHHAKAYRKLVWDIQPDLVHALRIPFEGMMGGATPIGMPFLVSTWGNDLTLHAEGSLLIRNLTKRCLRRADGLMSDTQRDIRLAERWGLEPDTPTLVVPGSSGVDMDRIRQAPEFNPNQYGIPKKDDWVVNPRGIRPGSVHQDVFITAAAILLTKKPNTAFICPGLADNPKIIKQVKRFGISKQVFLLPNLPQSKLWALMKETQVYVSPSSHDGTPNTLLEAMTCRCFPIAGDIASLREWIDPGINGFLVNPHDPEALASAILKALESPNLRREAAQHNTTLIQSRAARRTVLPKIENFYNKYVQSSRFSDKIHT